MTSVGVFADLTDQTMRVLDFARAVEARELSGLFLNEHTHLPVDHPTSHFPAGGGVPERYARFWDPYVALSFVAATTSLEIGTGVSLVGEHDPIQLAHAVATLDTLSGGRFVLGVGWGWNREEFADHGRPPEHRAAIVEEWVLVMRELWTREIASFDGRFVTLAPSRMWPKPVQQPGPPVLLGGPARGATSTGSPGGPTAGSPWERPSIATGSAPTWRSFAGRGTTPAAASQDRASR